MNTTSTSKAYCRLWNDYILILKHVRFQHVQGKKKNNTAKQKGTFSWRKKNEETIMLERKHLYPLLYRLLTENKDSRIRIHH